MISLERQIQSSALSLLFGMIFMFFYEVMKRLLLRRCFVFKLICELNLFINSSYIYYVLNVYVNEGYLNIYIPLFIVVGIYLYHKFYSKYILDFLEKIIQFINKLIINKLKLAIMRLYGIMKSRKRVRKDAKKQQSRSRSLESKQSGQYSYDWSFFNSDHVYRKNRS